MAQRALNFYKVKRLVDILNLVAIIVGVWVFFWPYPYPIAILSALVLPLLALIVFKRCRGMVQIDERENNVSPSVFWTFFLPTMALLIRSLSDPNIFDHGEVWVIVWPLTVGLASIILIGQPEFGWRKGGQPLAALAMIILAFAYAYGAVITSNCAFDNRSAASFDSQILNKSISRSKNTSYYLELAPWRPQPEVKDAEVDRETYEQLEVGDSVEVLFLKGRWGIPWYVVRPG